MSVDFFVEDSIFLEKKDSNIKDETTLRPISGRELAVKRIVDVVVCSVVLVAISPFLLFVALLIKLDSPGAIIFRQKRWGKDNAIITVYKFRSMATDKGDPTGVEQTVKSDPRVTRVGRMLRKSNIDELPQLLNVIKGDMSLVGPRCHALGMKAAGVLYEDLVPTYHLRHRVRPGITGLAQVRGFRGPTDTAFRAKARVNADLYYIDHFSLLFDLKILLGTIRNEIVGGTGS